MDPSVLDPWWTEEGGAGKSRGVLNSPVDLATALVSGGSTCQELGHQAFAFFEVRNSSKHAFFVTPIGTCCCVDERLTELLELLPFLYAYSRNLRLTDFAAPGSSRYSVCTKNHGDYVDSLRYSDALLTQM